jgi:hypothetical protein
MLKKLSSFKDEVLQEQNELDDFDPMAELHKLQESNLNNNERKSVWKMKYHMKNDLSKKAEKESIINQTLLPGIKEICLQNVAEVKSIEINDLI